MTKVRLFFCLATLLSQAIAKPQPKDTSFNSSIRLLNNLYQKLSYYYIEPVDKNKLTRKAVDGMMSLLDPWSYFMSKEEAEEKKIELNNKYGGIGISYRKLDNEIVVTQVKKGYPGDKAGIKASDVLLSANGKSFKGLETADVRAILLGDPGTTVTVIYKRQGIPTNITSTITREVIKLTSVPYYGMVDEHTGYIMLNGMTDKCNEDVRSALLELKKNSQLQGVILDLRDNGGGYRREAEAISNLFLDKGKMVVRVKGRTMDTTYYTQNDPVDAILPLVVLISRNTASSAEILSGTLQDHDRAVFIGQRSYGKAMIQTIHELGDGNQATITLAYYYTPSGRCIQLKTFTDGVGKLVSDSLQKIFKTTNGRTIISNGAIRPDIITEPARLPLLAFAAYQQDLFYKFAINYHSKHQDIPLPSKFVLTDEEFNEFYQRLIKGNYSFVTPADKKLDEWKEAAIEADQWKQSEAAYHAFKQAIENDKKKELETGKHIIKSWLESEISAMYYYDAGRIEAAIKDDPTVLKAREILANRKMYNSILGIR